MTKNFIWVSQLPEFNASEEDCSCLLWLLISWYGSSSNRKPWITPLWDAFVYVCWQSPLLFFKPSNDMSSDNLPDLPGPILASPASLF